MVESRNVFGVDIPGILKGERIISYTQFSMYRKCPHEWKLTYPLKHRSYEPNIYFVFGTAIHNTIQKWLEMYYTDSIKSTDDICVMFKDYMLSEFDIAVKKHKKTFSTSDELMEFYNDGCDILIHIKYNITQYFNKRRFEYLGDEIPIVYTPNPDKPTVKLLGYLDLVFYEKATGILHIKDIKTSTKGWSSYQQMDLNKISQLVLYKYYFSKLYNVEMRKIKVEYFIVRRKVDVDSVWVNTHVQEFIPMQSDPTIEKIINEFELFVENCFNNDGSYNLKSEYKAIAGVDDANCKFCIFKDSDELCPKLNRLER